MSSERRLKEALNKIDPQISFVRIVSSSTDVSLDNVFQARSYARALFDYTAATLLPFLTTAKDAPAVVEMVERVSCPVLPFVTSFVLNINKIGKLISETRARVSLHSWRRRRPVKSFAVLSMADSVSSGRLYQGVERDGFGMRMLASMGWQEGKGIGKSGSGLVKHIHAKKRAVNSGIGADARSDSSGKIDWTLNAVSFETILKGLNQTYTTLDTSMASNEGTNNKQAHVRSDVVGQGVKKKTARAGRTSVAHQGRYQKRESQKRVQNYSATDLNAILGGVGGFSAAPTPMYSSGGHNAEKAKADKSDAVQRESKEEKKRKREEKRKKILSPTLPPETTDLVTNSPHTIPPPPQDWWGWAVGFIPSGYHGSGTQEKVAEVDRRERGFNEADQEQLALAAHDGANRGKRGLGVGTTTVKSLKSEFVGKRFKFSDNLEEGVEGEVCTEMVKESLDGPTTVKVAKKIIKKAGGSMDLSDLLKKVTRKMSLNDDGHAQGMPEYQAKVKSHLKDCGVFSVVDGKSKAAVVTLKEARD